MSNEMSLYQAQEMAAASASAPTNNMLSTREAQEVQAAVFMAKRFPRDENAAMSRIMRACERKGLAAKATYSYPKGETNVTGPSIRLAEAIAQSWGNIQSGVVELSQQEGESTCMAYCWDIETNTRECKIFTVKHQISTKNGMKVLTDPRDIYELVANQGARRKRACILNIIPGDVVDAAVERCNRTLQSGEQRPLIDRLREMTDRFQKNFSVPLSSIEQYFGYPLNVFTAMDGQTLAGIYNALREGAAKREDYFKLPKVAEDTPEEPATPEDSPAPKKKTGKQVSMDEL